MPGRPSAEGEDPVTAFARREHRRAGDVEGLDGVRRPLHASTFERDGLEREDGPVDTAQLEDLALLLGVVADEGDLPVPRLEHRKHGEAGGPVARSADLDLDGRAMTGLRLTGKPPPHRRLGLDPRRARDPQAVERKPVLLVVGQRDHRGGPEVHALGRAYPEPVVARARITALGVVIPGRDREAELLGREGAAPRDHVLGGRRRRTVDRGRRRALTVAGNQKTEGEKRRTHARPLFGNSNTIRGDPGSLLL